MSEVIAKNFEVIRTTMNAQAQTIRELQEKVQFLEGHLANLQADIQNTKQLIGHLSGRGTGSTVHN